MAIADLPDKRIPLQSISQFSREMAMARIDNFCPILIRRIMTAPRIFIADDDINVCTLQRLYSIRQNP